MKMQTLIIVLLPFAILAGEGATVGEQFSEKYEEWIRYISKPEICAQSTATGRINNQAFDAIVRLGVPALPYVAQKLENDGRATVIWHAICRIAKVRIRSEYDIRTGKISFPEFPESIEGENIYLYWWKKGRFTTEARFNMLYAEWKSYKKTGSTNEIDCAYQHIVNLGLPVLPYLVNVVEESPEFVVAVSELSGGDVPKNAKPEECKIWWEKNKERYILPPSEDVIPQSHVGDAKISVALPNHTGGATTKNMNRKESTSAKDSRSDGGKVLCDDSN